MSIEKILFPDYNKMRPPQQKMITLGIEAYLNEQVAEILGEEMTVYRNDIVNDLIKLQDYIEAMNETEASAERELLPIYEEQEMKRQREVNWNTKMGR